jgi:hypothetical protein
MKNSFHSGHLAGLYWLESGNIGCQWMGLGWDINLFEFFTF